MVSLGAVCHTTSLGEAGQIRSASGETSRGAVGHTNASERVISSAGVSLGADGHTAECVRLVSGGQHPSTGHVDHCSCADAH